MHPSRKLTAILMADIVSYSRMMREDEAGTYVAVKALRDEIFPSVIASHAGRLIKEMGDGFLVIFDSAVQAVQCGMALQEAISDQSSLLLRVGVNVGDTIIEADDVFGDGVNIAARLESICTPGGVCLSENTYEQVRDKLDIVLVKLEPQQFKNIDRPVGARLWRGVSKKSEPLPEEPTIIADKPSIAVLAFSNMSSDPEQEFFAEGIAEDIITALSRIARFFVVSRTSSFSFKGQNVGVKDIGESLGVRYVLEGSVRAAGGRLRVTAQLIEAATGRHIWAEKYDRMAEDVFDIQDEITRNVVASIDTQIALSEGQVIPTVERLSLPAWRLVNVAWKHVYELSCESLPKAIQMAKEAVELEPTEGRAHQVLSAALFHHAVINSPADAEKLYRDALKHAEIAVRNSANDELSYWVRACANDLLGNYELAIDDLDRAIEINPSSSLSRGLLGSLLVRTGDLERSIEENMISVSSDPRNPSLFFRYAEIGLAHLLSENLQDAEAWARKAVKQRRDYLTGHAVLIATLVALGRMEEARTALTNCELHCASTSLKNALRLGPGRREHVGRFAQLLKSAGMK